MDEGVDLETMFTAFSKYGDPKSDGKTITLTQCDKWMIQAKILDMKKITTTDTGVCFNKYKSRTIDFKTFKKYVEDLATTKGINSDELFEKLRTCGTPGGTGTKVTPKLIADKVPVDIQKPSKEEK